MTYILSAILLLAESALVNVHDTAPGIRLDIRYATARNFTGTILYDQAACYLRAPAARALAAVQRELASKGLGLKVYDCYRPLSVQRKLWRLVPNERYVANPEKGSRHNRGAAVDLTLVDRNGRELPMPTEFDDFTERASRAYTALPEPAIRNRALLEDVMKRHGFLPLPTEWWHFDFSGWEQYPLEDVPIADLQKSSIEKAQ